ncbi:hypothetical protein ACJX0J_036021, partial [Zea mays]
ETGLAHAFPLTLISNLFSEAHMNQANLYRLFSPCLFKVPLGCHNNLNASILKSSASPKIYFNISLKKITKNLFGYYFYGFKSNIIIFYDTMSASYISKHN